MKENLSAAEKIIQSVLTYTDHCRHNRPGAILPDNKSVIGIKWLPVTHQVENNQKVVYSLTKVGNKLNKVRLGILQDDLSIKENNRNVATYRKPGLFPEVILYLYKSVADIYSLDNEFAAKWASYAYEQDHKDLKVILACFMLVQSRKGDPVKENGKVVFFDDDYRDVGEAMMLVYRKDNKDLNPRLLLRMHEILSLPEVAKLNRELGFTSSERNPFYGRWSKVVEKWLSYREENPKLLEGLVKAGFKNTVMELARRSGYKPTSEKFFDILRWKQVQAKDGRRTLAIGKKVAYAENWNELNEKQICERIIETKPNFKRIVGMLPKTVGLTPAIMAAAIEAKSVSDKDLVIYTPTLEELGLLKIKEIKDRWTKALKNADDMRSANIASKVKNKETKELLNDSADNALKKAAAEVTKNLRIYFVVDISGSMEGAIEAAKSYLAKFLQAFPPEQIHISVFNTVGREIKLKAASAAGVEQAFRGISASGGTSYAEGIKALQHHKPKENEDVLVIFVGDEGAADFKHSVEVSGLNPIAFGFIKVVNPRWPETRFAVQNTATQLGIPCFMISEETFSDVYAIPRVINNLILSTPVSAAKQNATVKRETLVDLIQKQNLLQKPNWA